MKKFLGFIVLVLVLTGLQSCISFKDIEMVNFGGYNITRTEDNQARLRMTATLNNPNSFNIKIKKSKIQLSVNGNDAGEIRLVNKILIEKNKQGDYEVILAGDQQKIMKAITSSGIGIALSGKVTLTAKGWVKGKAFGIGKKVKFEEKKTLSLKDLGLNQ